MDSRSTYNSQTTVLSFQEELERLRIQAVMGWTKEFRNLAWYGLRNGMRVLEVGSGPGYITEQLLNSLPDSEITSLEIDHTLQSQAKERLKDVSSERLQFMESSIYQMDLPDDTFDFVVARLIFLHLHNPIEAAQEIYRVLKPGGRLAIIDVDDGVFGAVNPDIPALHTVLMKIADYVAQHGGNRLIGRSLPRLLSESGYIHIDMDTVLQHSDLLGIEGFKQQFNLQRFVHFVEKGIISEEEFAQLQGAFEAINHSPEAYAMMNFITACGTKPLS